MDERRAQPRDFGILFLPLVPQARAGEFGDRLVGSVLRLLLDAGFLFLLRFSLDDRVDGVIAAALHALRALLVAPGDEVQRKGPSSIGSCPGD